MTIPALSTWIAAQEPKITQAQAAERFGVSDSHLSLVLKGKRKLSPEDAKRVSELTGIPPRELRPDLAALFEAAE